MKGRVGERGYEGESLTGKGVILLGGGFLILEEEASWRGTEALVGWLVYVFFWFCGRVFQTVSIIAGGIGLLGVLGTGARIPFIFLELGIRTGCS
jgi:hypothetical protein